MKPTSSITCITTSDYQPTIKSLRRSIDVLREVANVVKVYWFSNRPFTEDVGLPVEWTYIGPLLRLDWPADYNRVSLETIPQTVDTDFNFYIQGDGMAVNTNAWTDDFFNYDYIGARWHFLKEYRVGNGGFSLRSRRLYQALRKINPAANTRYDVFPQNEDLHQLVIRCQPGQVAPEDNIICILLKDQLETEYGIRFAPVEIADQFSIEDYWDEECPMRGKSLGFHGRHGIHRDYGVDL